MTALVTIHLPLVAGAPDGIKKLRQLILALAIQGRLLPQDPADEPAKSLLARITTNRKLQKGIRATKGITAATCHDLGFSIPEGWVPVRLGELGDWGAGATPSRSNHAYYGGTTPWFKSGELTSDLIDSAEESVTELALKECSLRLNSPGDVLIAMYGATIGKTAILAVPATTNQAVCACTPFDGVYNRFLLVALKALKPNFVGQGAGGAQPNISKEKIVSTAMGLPPEQEQHRIVAKVDELMALCDKLEADQGYAEIAHGQLVQALLESLTQAKDAEDFQESWRRLSENFHTLFTTEASIDFLKKSVIQLGIMGKLVAQIEADEDAHALLSRIRDDMKICGMKSMQSKKISIATPEDSDQYLNLPKGWAWTRLASQVIHSSAGWSPNCESRQRVGDEWGVLKVSAVSWDEYRAQENKALPPNLTPRPEHEVKVGDFLVSRANTAELVAKSVVVKETPPGLMLSDKIIRLKLTKLCHPEFINLVNTSLAARSYYRNVAGGTSSSMKNVSREQILNLPIPLPPLAEQHRIVAKVDELMALCERLKANLTDARQQHSQLASVLVEEATA